MSFMKEAKPFASLTAGLLARKGHAKPAMRPGSAQIHAGHDDLGWNDIGGPDAPTAPPAAVEAPFPEVLRQQAEIARGFPPADETPSIDAPAEQANAASLPVPVSRAKNLGEGRAKAAFTLRLDAERHLRLRLACAVSHRSAQQIVTEALDALLAQRPDIDAIAGTLPVRTARRTK